MRYVRLTLQLRLHSFLIVLLNFATESWCGLALHSSLDFQNPKPKYFSFIGLVMWVFVAFTFSPSYLSIQLVIEYITLFAAASLLTQMTQSSAYLVKYSSRFSSSLSSSLSMMLLNNGDKFPPSHTTVHAVRHTAVQFNFTVYSLR